MTEQSKNRMKYNPYWDHIGLKEVELKKDAPSWNCQLFMK